MYSIQYFTQEAAEQAAKNVDDVCSNKFCPLIKDKCRQDCASRVFTQVRKNDVTPITAKEKTFKYTLSKYHCTNSIITGYVEVSN